MDLLTAAQVERIHEATDALGLHRTWVVVPLAASATPMERLLPDGKVLICAPPGAAFDGWIADLGRRLTDLDLSRTPKADQHQPHQTRGNAEAPPGSGPRKYLPWRERPSLAVEPNYAPPPPPPPAPAPAPAAPAPPKS